MKLGYWIYRIARSGARATGTAGPLRSTLGPSVARFVFKRSTGAGQPTQVNGHKMLLADKGQYPPFAMATDRYEVGTTRLLTQTIEPGMVVVDVGAHVGYFTLLAARQVGPTGKVYSFEPDPTNYRLLSSNIEANDYTNIVATQKAVSKTGGTANLMLSSRDNGTHSLFGQGNPDAESVAVDMVSLDDFLANEGWPKIDLIKMDVEGAEMDALEGMAQLFSKSPGLRMVVEFNPALLHNASVQPLEFLAKLVDIGFNVSVIDDQEGITPLFDSNSKALSDSLLKSEGSVNLFCLNQ